MTEGCHRCADFVENKDETEDSSGNDSDAESLPPLQSVLNSSGVPVSDDKTSCLEQIYEHPMHENPSYPIIPSTRRTAEGSYARTQDRANTQGWVNGLKPEDSLSGTGILSNSLCAKGLGILAGVRSGNHAPCPTEVRKQILNDIVDWIKEPGSPPYIMWSSGRPGAGKSAIAQSIVDRMKFQGSFVRRSAPKATSSAGVPEAGIDNGAHGRPNRGSEQAFAEAQQSSYNYASPEEPYTQTRDQGYYYDHYKEPPGPGFFNNAQEFTMNDTNQFDFTGAKDPTVSMIGSYHHDDSSIHIHQETGSAAPWAFVAGASIALQVQSILRPMEQSVREKQNDSHTSSGPNVEVDASHLLSTCTLLIMGLRHKLPDVMCSKIRKQVTWPHEDAQITRDQSDAYSIQVTYEKVTVSLSSGDGRTSSLD